MFRFYALMHNICLLFGLPRTRLLHPYPRSAASITPRCYNWFCSIHPCSTDIYYLMSLSDRFTNTGIPLLKADSLIYLVSTTESWPTDPNPGSVSRTIQSCEPIIISTITNLIYLPQFTSSTTLPSQSISTTPNPEPLAVPSTIHRKITYYTRQREAISINLKSRCPESSHVRSLIDCLQQVPMSSNFL